MQGKPTAVHRQNCLVSVDIEANRDIRTRYSDGVERLQLSLAYWVARGEVFGGCGGAPRSVAGTVVAAPTRIVGEGKMA